MLLVEEKSLRRRTKGAGCWADIHDLQVSLIKEDLERIKHQSLSLLGLRLDNGVELAMQGAPEVSLNVHLRGMERRWLSSCMHQQLYQEINTMSGSLS